MMRGNLKQVIAWSAIAVCWLAMIGAVIVSCSVRPV